MSGEDAPRPYLENLIVPEIKTNKQTIQARNKTMPEKNGNLCALTEARKCRLHVDEQPFLVRLDKIFMGSVGLWIEVLEGGELTVATESNVAIRTTRRLRELAVRH